MIHKDLIGRKIKCGKCGKEFLYPTYHKCKKWRLRKYSPEKSNALQNTLMALPILLLILSMVLFFITEFKVFFLSLFLLTLVLSVVSVGYLIRKTLK